MKQKISDSDRKVMELRQKMKLEKTIKNMNEKVNNLDIKIEELVEKAKEAKKKGSRTALQVAKMGLANAIGTKHKIEEMICQIDILTSMKDVAQISKDFVNVVGDVCKDVNGLTQELNFKDVNKEIGKTLENTENSMNQLDTIMNSLMNSVEDSNFKISSDLNKEVDALLEDQDPEEEMKKENILDDEISKKLAQLKI